MRYIVIAFVLLVAPRASAQQTLAPNISGFRLGMSVDEARDVAPRLFRRGERRTLFRVTQHSHRFGNTAFPLSLIFSNGVLDYVGGDSTLVIPLDMCLNRHQTLVEALESTLGPLRDAEAAERVDGELPATQTAGGSYIRRYSTSAGVVAIATATTPIDVEVRTQISNDRDGFWECETTYGISASAPAPLDLPVSTIESARLLAPPTSVDIERAYPSLAAEVRRPGKVTLICAVAEGGALVCNVGHENPAGWGFGEAAIAVSSRLRMEPQTSDGTATAGATIRLDLRFQMRH
ncbi:MAG: hypothetical protein AB7O98_15250 [Hyphomonadaceae bacterium]